MTQETQRLRIPYPSDGQDPYYPAFQSMVQSLDTITFSGISDRNTLMYGGGNVTWLNQVLTTTEPLVYVEPTFGQRQTLATMSELSIPLGHFLYVDLSRGNTSSVSLAPLVSSSVPVSTTASVLAWHHPQTGVLYWRTGAKQIDGQVITGVEGGSNGTSGSYVLAEIDASLPNSRYLQPGVSNTIAINDEGAGGRILLDLAEQPGVAGDYTLASLTVNNYGQITEITPYIPTDLGVRTIDETVESKVGYFNVVQNTTGIRMAGTYGDGMSIAEAVDSSGLRHRYINHGWESVPVTSQAFMQVQMVYPFKIPADAISMTHTDYRFRHFIQTAGLQAQATVIYFLHMGDETASFITSLEAGDQIVDVPVEYFAGLDIQAHQGAQCTLTVTITNSLDASNPFTIEYGPLQLTFMTGEDPYVPPAGGGGQFITQG